MTHQQLIARLNEIRPGARFVLIGNTYDGLEWFDSDQQKPTLEELGLE